MLHVLKVLVYLSEYDLAKETQDYAKKRWTHEGPWLKEKLARSHLNREESYQIKEQSSPHISTHLHILI